MILKKTFMFNHNTRVVRGMSLCVRFIAIIFFMVMCLVSCEGCNSSSSSSSDNNIGWIAIKSSAVTISTDGIAMAELNGDAFVSPSYVAHQCAGLACIFGQYDNSYPGVDVTWTNITTGTQGTATSRYGTATSWDHLWYASVPVVAGDNQLQVTAADPADNFATVSVSFEYIPPAPNDLRADTNDGQITLNWSPVPEATAYRLYWSTTQGVAFPYGTIIDVTAPPFVHTGLANGTIYYYVITSLYQGRESAPSTEIQATSGAPSKPANFSASLIGPDVELSWDAVATADTYTLYWANETGVTKQDGIQVPGVISPYLHIGLSGVPYYYVVTAVNGYGESLETEEVMAFPEIAPPTPEGLKVSQRYGFSGYVSIVDLAWQSVPGAYDYNVYRCHAWSISTSEGCEPSPSGCYGPWEQIGTNFTDTDFIDGTVDYVAYWYYVTARNAYGSSLPSEWVGLCVKPPW